jgi:hypothetical protein
LVNLVSKYPTPTPAEPPKRDDNSVTPPAL